MKLLQKLDPAGVEQRRSHRLHRRKYFNKGPNFVWHIDGYDKLSPYGFHIHGCVDGYNRRLMWLRVSSTNHNPGVILQYYLETVKDIGGCPSVIRMDCGTENVKVAAAQFAFRAYHSDAYAGESSFAYGSSPANVRIEGLWSQLRRSMTDWWICVFKELRQQGLFNCANNIHRNCLAVVFLPLIENELNAFKVYWNGHNIRKSHSDCISGRPDDLYDMPTFYGCENYLKAASSAVWIEAMSSEACKPEPMYSAEFYAECYQLVLQHFGIDLSRDINNENCVDVYLYLTSLQ